MLTRPAAPILCCLLSLTMCSYVLGNDKVYPEQGKVIANRTVEYSRTAPVYTDPYGKTHGGVSGVGRLPVFRVETDTKIYELEGAGKRGLVLGDTIKFRLEKKWAYVQQGDKEQKFRVVGTELKQGK